MPNARTTLYSPAGDAYTTADPVEITRLKGAHGYTEAPPAGTPSRSRTAVPVQDDPSKHNVDAVKAYVGDNPGRAQAVLDLEQDATRPRSTLVGWLEHVADGDDSGPEAGDDGPGSAGA